MFLNALKKIRHGERPWALVSDTLPLPAAAQGGGGPLGRERPDRSQLAHLKKGHINVVAQGIATHAAAIISHVAELRDLAGGVAGSGAISGASLDAIVKARKWDTAAQYVLAQANLWAGELVTRFLFPVYPVAAAAAAPDEKFEFPVTTEPVSGADALAKLEIFSATAKALAAKLRGDVERQTAERRRQREASGSGANRRLWVEVQLKEGPVRQRVRAFERVINGACVVNRHLTSTGWEGDLAPAYRAFEAEADQRVAQGQALVARISKAEASSPADELAKLSADATRYVCSSRNIWGQYPVIELMRTRLRERHATLLQDVAAAANACTALQTLLAQLLAFKSSPKALGSSTRLRQEAVRSIKAWRKSIGAACPDDVPGVFARVTKAARDAIAAASGDIIGASCGKSGAAANLGSLAVVATETKKAADAAAPLVQAGRPAAVMALTPDVRKGLHELLQKAARIPTGKGWRFVGDGRRWVDVQGLRLLCDAKTGDLQLSFSVGAGANAPAKTYVVAKDDAQPCREVGVRCPTSALARNVCMCIKTEGEGGGVPPAAAAAAVAAEGAQRSPYIMFRQRGLLRNSHGHTVYNAHTRATRNTCAQTPSYRAIEIDLALRPVPASQLALPVGIDCNGNNNGNDDDDDDNSNNLRAA